MVESVNTAPDTASRQAWMGLLAKAPEGLIGNYLNKIIPQPEFTFLRSPEIGSVMVRGKTSGTGTAFNLGEVTVTRCVLKLASGEVGHAYVQGRRKLCAQAAALVDAMMQTEYADTVQSMVLEPLKTHAQQRSQDRASKAAATKVDFFTMARGED
ncbi:MAG: phosphonate C-P lyase system protein PhnG [Granulosicoccus sp.]|nr:phosphonate C-P lyase system protein PhnG [Granulosicoccus sp.]